MGDKCIVFGCVNLRQEGTFSGDLCVPCYNMLHLGCIAPTSSFLGSLQRERDEAVELVRDLVGQHCSIRDEGDGGEIDSRTLSGNRDAIKFLSRCGKIEILYESGRRVIGKWKKQEAHDEKA